MVEAENTWQNIPSDKKWTGWKLQEKYFVDTHVQNNILTKIKIEKEIEI